MSNCGCSCSYASVIAGIIAGVILGVLSALGFVTTVVIFWAYLALGFAGILVSPVYGLLDRGRCGGSCFCAYRKLLLISGAGTVIAAAVSLIIASLTAGVAVAIATGIATFFAVTMLGTIICITRCIDCE